VYDENDATVYRNAFFSFAERTRRYVILNYAFFNIPRNIPRRVVHARTRRPRYRNARIANERYYGRIEGFPSDFRGAFYYVAPGVVRRTNGLLCPGTRKQLSNPAAAFGEARRNRQTRDVFPYPRDRRGANVAHVQRPVRERGELFIRAKRSGPWQPVAVTQSGNDLSPPPPPQCAFRVER